MMPITHNGNIKGPTPASPANSARRCTSSRRSSRSSSDDEQPLAHAAAAVVMQICLGAAYGWSVFVAPLVSMTGWTLTQVSLNFTFAIAFLGVGTVIGGLWTGRYDQAIYTVAVVMLVSLVLPLVVRRPARPGPLHYEPAEHASDLRSRA